jgi:KOW motif-containing protein
MSEPQHVQDSIKVGVMVNVVDGPHKGKSGKVTEIYRDWKLSAERTHNVYRAFIELPDGTGCIQTRVEWLVRIP